MAVDGSFRRPFIPGRCNVWFFRNAKMKPAFDVEAVQRELSLILDEPEFRRSEILSRFLTYVVVETLEGRASGLKSVVIAQAVFNRAPTDEGADNAVRTAAVRLRAALSAHNERRTEPAEIIFSIPKGGYVPEFKSAPECAQLGSSGRLSGRLAPWMVWAILVAVVLSISFVATVILTGNKSSVAGPVIYVHPVEANGDLASNLAQAINYRLAPQLAEIGLADIVFLGAHAAQVATGELSLHLRSSLDATGSDLRLYLVDGSGLVKWSGREVLPSGDVVAFNRAISAVAFKILGENGAIPFLYEQQYGQSFEGSSCVTRAQLFLRVQRTSDFLDITNCLEAHLAANPRDAAAWAALGSTLVVRSRYRAALESDDLDSLVARARVAVAKATEFAPTSYMTRVASMQIALAIGDTAAFRRRQAQLRRDYPGDIYLHMRIASRLARLGDFSQALEIYDQAQAMNAHLSDRWAEIALAHYIAGNQDDALEYIGRSHSQQQYVLLLKAAIFSRGGLTDKAVRAVNELVALNPDIAREFYPWHLQLGWSEEVLTMLADDLSRAGLQVFSDASM